MQTHTQAQTRGSTACALRKKKIVKVDALRSLLRPFLGSKCHYKSRLQSAWRQNLDLLHVHMEISVHWEFQAYPRNHVHAVGMSFASEISELAFSGINELHLQVRSTSTLWTKLLSDNWCTYKYTGVNVKDTAETWEPNLAQISMVPTHFWQAFFGVLSQPNIVAGPGRLALPPLVLMSNMQFLKIHSSQCLNDQKQLKHLKYTYLCNTQCGQLLQLSQML